MYLSCDIRLCPRLCFLRITNLRENRILENPENIDKSHVMRYSPLFYERGITVSSSNYSNVLW